MISAVLEILNFLFYNFKFPFSLLVISILSIVLQKSIKKHANVYYWIFGVLSFIYFIPTIGSWTGLFSFSYYYIPIIGNIMTEFAYIGYLAHPMFVIIMYMGALSTKNKTVAGLMSIRKELSILVGFIILVHGLKRIMMAVWALGYFFDHEEFMSSPRVINEIASAVLSSVFVLGIVMFVLLLVLWITSFDGVRSKMKFKKWKAVQRWSYALYAMLFIQAFGIHLSTHLNELTREKMLAQNEQLIAHVKKDIQGEKKNVVLLKDSLKYNKQESAKPISGNHNKPANGKALAKEKVKKKHHHKKRESIGDIRLERKTTSLLNMIFLIALYGSYLVLRVDKARKDKKRRQRKNT